MVERVGIDIEAEDDTGDAFETAAGRIESLGDRARSTATSFGALSTSAEDSGRRFVQLSLYGERVRDSAARATMSFQDLAKGAASAANTLETGMSVMTRMDLVQITLEQSSRNVAEAQERHNEAVARFGAESQQAQQAAQALSDATDNLDKTQLRAQLSMVLVAGQVVAMAAQVPRAVQAMNALRVSVMAATAAHGALAVTLTGGLAAAGIVVGIMAIKTAMDSLSTSAGRATTSLVSFTDAGADARLEAARQELRLLGEEIEKLQEDISFTGWGDWPNWGDNPGNREKLEGMFARAEELRNGLLKGEDEIADARTRAADEWVKAEEIRRIETVGSWEEVSAAATRYTAIAEDARAKLAAPVTLTQRAENEAILQDAESHLEALGKRVETLKDQAVDAATATSEAWRDALAGINLGNLQMGDLAQVAAYAEALGAAGQGLSDLAAKHQAARAADDELARQMLNSGVPALEAQATATRLKGETTEQLVERLGLTTEQEQELTASGRLTTEGLISQEEATRRLEAATRSMFETQAAANADLMPTWVPTGGGSWKLQPGAAVQVGGTGNDAMRSIHQIDIARQGTMSGPGMALLDMLDARVKSDPNIRGTTDFQYASAIAARAAEGQGMGANGLMSAVMVNALRNLGVRFAANGYDGMVSGPTMFIAGEAGPEHVRISPGGHDRSGGPALVVNGGVHVNVGSRTAPGPLTMAVRDGLTIPARRAASRRGY